MLRKTALRILLIVPAAAAAGCQDPLFPEDAPRSPYQRYEGLRGQSRPETELDAYGRERPALRERLRPLDQP